MISRGYWSSDNTSDDNDDNNVQRITWSSLTSVILLLQNIGSGLLSARSLSLYYIVALSPTIDCFVMLDLFYARPMGTCLQQLILYFSTMTWLASFAALVFNLEFL